MKQTTSSIKAMLSAFSWQLWLLLAGFMTVTAGIWLAYGLAAGLMAAGAAMIAVAVMLAM